MLSPVTEFVVCVFGNTQHVSYSLCVGLVVGVLNYSGGLESLRDSRQQFVQCRPFCKEARCQNRH